jgi:predicted short-subunit dehydrogenase-like oxidoreductase (DUF2520 family)
MKIVLLGSGNVATHLGLVLQKAGNTIIQVWSQHQAHADELAALLNAVGTMDILQITPDADLYILAVKDDAISKIATKLSLTDQLIIHTSGSTDIHILEGVSKKFGVIYPVQTFSKNKMVDFKAIPVLVEGNTSHVTKKLLSLAGQISGQVMELDSAKRKALHIAAVFACNFTNYLYTLSDKIISEHGLDFNLLRPVIAETASKVQEFSPANVQTGPAIRNDKETIKKHLDYLKRDPELYDLYTKLSEGIIKSRPLS